MLGREVGIVAIYLYVCVALGVNRHEWITL